MTTIMPAPSTAYDPTLVLGSVVNYLKVKYIQKIAEIQKPQLLAQKRLDDMMISHNKLQMVNDQMINMEVSTEDMVEFRKETKKMKRAMARASLAFAKATINLQQSLLEIDAKVGKTIFFDTRSTNSPIDHEKSVLKKSPVAPESMSMDVQYFRNETNSQGVSTLPSKLSRFISSKYAAWSSAPVAHKLSKKTFNMTLAQAQNHSLQGTLVICANFTHKQADIYDPLVLDPEKALSSWNDMFPKDRLKKTKKAIVDVTTKPTTQNERALYVVSGLTKGSSFVGLVHVLNDYSDQTNSSMKQKRSKMLSNQLEKEQKAGNDFGTQSKVAKRAMNLLSTSTILSHCSLITEGMIPVVETSSVTTDVKTLKSDPEDIMKQLAAIMKANDSVDSDESKTTEAKEQTKAKMSAHLTKLNSEHIKNVVAALGERYQNENKLFDIDNLMTAFTDFVAKAKEGEGGIPLQFYFKVFTKSDIANVYGEKFYPEEEEKEAESGVEEGKEAGSGGEEKKDGGE